MRGRPRIAMTGSADLAAWLDAIAGARVLCVGDVMLDRFVYGEVSRVSPEAPIPVCRVGEETSMPGGAGNVARNLAALGARVEFVAVTGKDPARDELEAHLAALDCIRVRLFSDPGRVTTVKTRYIAAGQQLLRADRERPDPIGDGLAAEIERHVADCIGSVGAVVLSDYDKGVLTPSLTRTLIGMANDAGIPVLVDPKGTDYAVYAGAQVVTPNRLELRNATGMPVDGDETIVAAARRVIASCGVDSVLATRGGDGMTYVTAEDAAHLAAEARDVFDVSGAGDTVIAVLAAAIAAGVPRLDAARIANIAAGIVVGRTGTAVAASADVRAALRASVLLGGQEKIVSGDAAIGRVAEWRARRETVGFTNGVFDLLHPGHVSLLAQARAACDHLVVGLNSDASVKRIKGPDRPIQTEDARASVLASLAAADLVVIFGGDTPEALIEALRPDILVKGADYALDQVVGADFVRSYGGRVLLADLTQGHSTTGMISRMAE